MQPFGSDELPGIEPDLELPVLWFVFPRLVRDPQLLKRYRGILSPDELVQEARFRFPDDRHRYLLTRALTRLTLSRFFAFDAREWRFTPDESGRPRVTTGPAGASDLQFNISHTNEAIVLCVAGRNAVGVDIENLDSRPAPLDVAPRHFAPSEAAALDAVAPEQRHARFFAYWTLKESYIKARGKGLALPLSEFGFELDDSSTRLHFWANEPCDAAPDRWRFWQFATDQSHVAAVCVARSPRDFGAIKTLTCVPGVSEVPLTVMLLRHSH